MQWGTKPKQESQMIGRQILKKRGWGETSLRETIDTGLKMEEDILDNPQFSLKAERIGEC
jgi:hypothetical protein